jgi:hypothetical protein
MSTRKWKPADIKYSGRRVSGDCEVILRRASGGKTLLTPEESRKVWNHSPAGFNWGYGGSGPAQLALAILMDFTRDKNLAVQHHQAFKWAFVSRWQGDIWELTGEEIQQWLHGAAGIKPKEQVST